MSTAEITQPLKWFGGKHYLAERIIALMPPHLHYVEPYAGGLAVLFAKDPEGVSEVVNDIHQDLTNFWRTLAIPDAFVAFTRQMQAMPFSEYEWGTATCRLKSPFNDTTRRACEFFVACRQSRAGQFKDFATLSKTRTRRGMNEQASAWLTAVEGLPAVHARLKRVAILNRDALDVIRQQDGPDTCFYLDPPYLHETRESKDVYAHEMTEVDHLHLLQLLAKIEGKFLLSGYRSKLYDEWASGRGWNRHEFQIVNNASGKKTKDVKTECVWTNF